MAKKPRIRDYDQFIVRLPDGWRDRISEAAQHNARSMNAEIVERIGQTFDPTLISVEMAEAIEAFHQCEAVLKNTKTKLAKSEETRELLGRFVEAMERENIALRKAGIISERLIFEIAHAVSKAADGDPEVLQRLVEREKIEPTLKKLVTELSIVRDD